MCYNKKFMRDKCLIVNLLLFIFFFVSCGNNSGAKKAEQIKDVSGSSYDLKYAKGFKLNTIGETKILQVSNPWQGVSGVEFTYYLKPDADPRKMDEIRIPVNKVICLSTTHIAYIESLDKAETIDGVSGATYVSNPTVRQRIADKKVFDVGYESGLSYETVVNIKPDVVFAYGVSGELTGIVAKLNELGIKVVFLGDYLEETALGKSEWLMVMASFYDMEDKAQKILNSIFDDYNVLKSKIEAEISNRPKVMLNAPWKDSWYIPGGSSYMVNLLKDAGADFILGNNDKRDSYPINIEKAYSEALKAEYWLNPNAAQSLNDIKQEDSRLAEISAFKQRKVYNNNMRMTPGGGSDFWESGVMNPNIILKDLIKIFHPQIVDDHRLVYFHQLK